MSETIRNSYITRVGASVAIGIALLLVLAACGGGEQEEPTPPTPPHAVAQPTTASYTAATSVPAPTSDVWASEDGKVTTQLIDGFEALYRVKEQLARRNLPNRSWQNPERRGGHRIPFQRHDRCRAVQDHAGR